MQSASHAEIDDARVGSCGQAAVASLSLSQQQMHAPTPTLQNKSASRDWDTRLASCRIRTLTSPIPRSSLTTRAQANKIEGYTLAGAHTIARSARRAATRSSPPCPRLINVFCYLYRIRSGEIVERGKTRRTCLPVIT